ncbi:MAG: alpha/beta hydrolase, partial [Bacteroidota bacterium]
MKGLLKISKWLSISIAVILLTGCIAERFIQTNLEKKYQPAAENFVTINGNKIHFEKRGTSGPTVVFQSGLGSDYRAWEAVQATLPDTLTSISYDKAGLLWSEGKGTIRTLEYYADELTQLLEKTNCPKPYILVGHSFAGVTLREFIRKNRADIAGIVFVDVTHPDQMELCSAELLKSVTPPPRWLIASLTETGMIRSMYSFTPFVPELPADHWFNRHTTRFFHTCYETMLDEAAADKLLFAQARKINSFDSIPLVILSATQYSATRNLKPALAEEYKSIHEKVQKDLLSLSSNSRQVFATKSGHFIQLEEPELVID